MSATLMTSLPPGLSPTLLPPMTSPMGLLQLPNGTFVALRAIQAIEARTLAREHVDHAGRSWPAAVVIETRTQMLRVPCASFAQAEALRDEIGALVNGSHATAMPSVRPPQRTAGPAPMPATIAAPCFAEAS